MEWVLVMAITTAAGVQTHVIPGFTSEATCDAATDPLMAALETTSARENREKGFAIKGANAQCIELKK